MVNISHFMLTGIGRSIRTRELEAIASQPNEEGNNVLIADSFGGLANLRQALTSAICNSKHPTIFNIL